MPLNSNAHHNSNMFMSLRAVDEVHRDRFGFYIIADPVSKVIALSRIGDLRVSSPFTDLQQRAEAVCRHCTTMAVVLSVCQLWAVSV